MRPRRALLLFILVACGSRHCSFDPSPSCSYRPDRLVPDAATEAITGWIDTVHAGDSHACALLTANTGVRGSRTRCWGGNAHAQLSRRGSPDPGEFWWYSGWSGYVSLGVGAAHACVFGLATESFDGGLSAECWGNNEAGQLGVGPDESVDGLVEVARLDLSFSPIALGGLHACVDDDEEGVRCWGDNRWGQLGAPNEECCDLQPAVLDPEGEPVNPVQLAPGTRHTCASTFDDEDASHLFCWGNNEFGQLGHGELGAAALPPAEVSFDLEAAPIVLAVAAGPHHTCAHLLPAEGERYLVCWGRNARGELGDGTTESRVAPARVELTFEPRAVYAGGESGLRFGDDLDLVEPGASHTCALDGQGHAYCWGDNSAGQLGVAASEPVLTPVATHPEHRFSSLALGGRFTCGILVGNEDLLCWGDNPNGQLGRSGESSHEATSVPVFTDAFAE